jgi:hypothetical protein
LKTGIAVGPDLHLGESKRHQQRYEPLLSAVVEVSLDAAPGVISRSEDSAAGFLEGFELFADFFLESIVVYRELGGSGNRL